MPAESSPFIRPIVDAGGITQAGGKGANLGALLRAGFPVPDGFVVTTAAYDRFVADHDLSSRVPALAEVGDTAAIRGLFEASPLAPEVKDAIVAAHALLGDVPVAVRSSATAEDLPGASFAGQQESFLNVVGPDAVVAAVRRCWASLWTERAVAYRAGRDAASAGPLSIAVVVQQLVDAEVAGVMFTADPTTGRRDETVITAAWGLGESVVGGTVDADAFRVRDGRVVEATVGDKSVMTILTSTGTAEVPTPPHRRRERTLSDARAIDLAGLGRRVADLLGVPQDIEWVLSKGAFHLVQARPITALPEPAGEVPTDWPVPRPGSLYFRASIVEQMPDPLTPLFADLVRPAVPAGLLGLMRELAPSLDTLDVDFPTINGYAFYDYSRRSFGQMLGFTPGALRLVGTKGFVLARWRDRELPRYRAAVAAWSERDPRSLSSGELLDAVQALLDAGCLYYTTVQSVIPVASMAELTWTWLYDRLLRRPGDAAASDYLLGFDSTPMAAEKALFALAGWVREDAALAASLATPGVAALAADPPAGVHPDRWAAWRERLDAHLGEFGHMTYNLDVANPVPADDPTPILAALRHAVAGAAPDPVERQGRLAARRERLAADLLGRLGRARARVARRSLQAAQAWGPIREDALAAMGLAWPTMRRLLRDLGRRLVDAGALEHPDDVFWLTLREARELGAGADAGASLTGRAEDVSRRRTAWRGQALATPPQYLPESALMRSMEGMMPARAQQEGPVLRGTTGSGGRVTAPARVLTGPQDFGAFRPGEVLVAAITTPAFTPLFALAAGVVTDIGGVLSHGSIVAREYAIPAVLGTGTATRRIRTGDLVTVDGGRGEVLLPGVGPEPHPASSSPAPGAAGLPDPARVRTVRHVALASAGVGAAVAAAVALRVALRRR